MGSNESLSHFGWLNEIAVKITNMFGIMIISLTKKLNVFLKKLILTGISFSQPK